MLKSFQVGSKTFVLDQAKAEAAFSAKSVINGRQVPYFNILPLKYQWAYDLYKTVVAKHGWGKTVKFFTKHIQLN